jgi:hypothetical protein
MKVGMIFECGPQGADVGVCTTLARKISPDIEIEHVTLNNKNNLIEESGGAADSLLKSGCQRVIIVWDLYPPWQPHGAHPCRHEDREDILHSLAIAGVDINQVALVCIREELEAWLIADGRGLSCFLSRSTHPVTVGNQRNVEQVRNPKMVLNRIFKNNIGRPYSDLTHAQKIADAIPDLSRLKRIPAFSRFMSKLSNAPNPK